MLLLNTYSKLIFSLCLLFLIIIMFCCRKWENIKHIHNKRQAKKVYKKLLHITNNNELWILSYLRKIDPFVFEELILYSFKKLGYKVYYNKKYTGDGGIDGKVKINGKVWLVQDKRYSGYINNEHIQKFNELCLHKHTKGFFVHTGKTGQGVSNVQNQFPAVRVISGEKLVSLIHGKYKVS